MPEFGTTIRSNLSERGNNVKGTAQGVVSNIKNTLGDIKDRFDLDQETEPKWGKQYMPGKAGDVGMLPETFMALPLSMANTVSKHVQEFARINRNWFKGRR